MWFLSLFKVKSEPVWTLDFDGEIRKSKLVRYPDGTLLIDKISGKVLAYSDGTVHEKSYIQKWWPR